MNQFAMCLGYAVMVASGVSVLAAIWVFALERMWRALTRRKIWKFVSEALNEWAKKHPEEAARQREREL